MVSNSLLSLASCSPVKAVRGRLSSLPGSRRTFRDRGPATRGYKQCCRRTLVSALLAAVLGAPTVGPLPRCPPIYSPNLRENSLVTLPGGQKTIHGRTGETKLRPLWGELDTTPALHYCTLVLQFYIHRTTGRTIKYGGEFWWDNRLVTIFSSPPSLFPATPSLHPPFSGLCKTLVDHID